MKRQGFLVQSLADCSRKCGVLVPSCLTVSSLVLLVAVVATCSPALAAPSILAVAKTGSTYTVTGAGFGAKTTPAPLRFETFSGASGTKVTEKGWWSTKAGLSQYSPSIKTGSSRVVGRNVADLSTDSKNTPVLFKNGIGFKATRKAYVNWWAYLDFSSLADIPVQIKLLNLLRNTNPTTSDNEYPDQATSLWQDMGNITRGTVARYYYGSGSAPGLSYKNGSGTNSNIFITKGWYNFIVQVDQGTMGNADGKTTMWLTGPGYTQYGMSGDITPVMQINAGDYLDSIKLWQYLQFRTTFTDASTFLNAYSAGYPTGVKVNYQGKGYSCETATGPRGSFTETPDIDAVRWLKNSDTPLVAKDTLYIDSLYIDNSFARVEICDAATWEGRAHCEIQPPTAWNNESVSFSPNYGTLRKGTAYVYVTDDAGAVNYAGYPVFIDSAPEPARNLRVIPK